MNIVPLFPLGFWLASAIAQELPAGPGNVDISDDINGDITVEAAIAPRPGPRLLDRVVAVVGDRVITASDVALEQVLMRRDASSIAELYDPSDTPLTRLIDAALVRGVAGDVAIYQPDAALVRARLSALRATWEDPADYEHFLASFGLDEGELAGVLFSRLVVELYLRRNIGLAAESAGLDAVQAQAMLRDWFDARRRQVPVRLVTDHSAATP